ncbi:GtrA family protein [Dysgonomonas sp. 511]|nr:GtrA family protein [Dysgonomonas sp. 511]
MFLRAQFSSQISSLADYAVSLTLVNAFGLYFGYATFFGNVTGGIVNCIVNYKWTFKAQGSKIKHVAVKYLMVWLVNLFLNTQGTVLVTTLVTRWIDPDNFPEVIANNVFLIPKIIVSLIVGFVWNYNMQRLFVYRDRDYKKYFKKLKEKPQREEQEHSLFDSNGENKDSI